jgi:hypothetical protein
MIIRFFILLLIFKHTLFSCAGGWNIHDKSFLFLEQRDFPFSNQPRNLKQADVYNDIYAQYERRAKEANLKEWQEYLGKKFDIKTIEEIVYKRQNLSLIKDVNTRAYLDFIQNQEQYVVNSYYSGEKTKITTKEEILIKEALKRINTNINIWLKVRYFYLSLRLAHYKKLKPLEIYKKYHYLLAGVKPTIVKDWVQGIYAGALIKDKQIEKGVYEFARLFEKDKINWHLPFYNFHHIKTKEQWNNLTDMASSAYKKTKLYALRALNKNSNIIEELKNIYTVDKNSIWFDYILHKALLESQHYFDEEELYVRNFPTQQFINYLKTVKKDDRYMVDLSLGYFNLYSNNLEEAKNIATKLIASNNNHEVQIFNYVVNLHQLKSIDVKTENDIYSQLIKLTNDKDHTSQAIHDYTFVILGKLYKKQNNSFKAFLSDNINYLNNSSFTLELLNTFNTFMNTKSESKIDEHFKNKYKVSKSVKATEIKLLINNLEFKKARKVESKYLKELILFNPFNVSISGNNRAGKKDTYTIKQFLDKIVAIKAVLKKDPNSVIDNYLYANALYNLSYFGNANRITTEYRSVYSFQNKSLELKKVNESIKYYEKALKHTKKKEFKAKIIYMLAKSELALFDIKFADKSTFYYSKDIDSHDLPRHWSYTRDKIYDKYIDNNYGKYFDKLKKEYSNTKYYDEIIKECANLRIYQKRK